GIEGNLWTPKVTILICYCLTTLSRALRFTFGILSLASITSLRTTVVPTRFPGPIFLSHYPRLRVAEESAYSWYTGLIAFREEIRDLVSAARDNRMDAAIISSLNIYIGLFPLSPRV
ncbi:unnamed protein product, partial [Penicillium nalgiovense]